MAKLLQDIKDTFYHIMNLSPDDNLLDIRCGTGIDAYKIAQIVGRAGILIGIDNDEKMIEEAKKKNYNAPNLEFIMGDAGDITFSHEYLML